MLDGSTYRRVLLLMMLISLKCYAFDDCDKYRRQGDSLFKACNYLAAIKKYKSCLIFKENDEYSLNKIKLIDEIYNKMRIASNLSIAGKATEAADMYKKVLSLNPDDIESKSSLSTILEAEADKKIKEGKDDEAIQMLRETIVYAEVEKIKPLTDKLKKIEDKKKTPEYMKLMEEGSKLMKAAKYEESIKKYSTIFNLNGFQKDYQAQKAIEAVRTLQNYKQDAAKYVSNKQFAEAIISYTKVLDGGINDNDVKSDLLKAYENQANKLLKDGTKEDAILLISKAIEVFDGDSKRQNSLQKKLKEITTAKKTTRD